MLSGLVHLQASTTRDRLENELVIIDSLVIALDNELTELVHDVLVVKTLLFRILLSSASAEKLRVGVPVDGERTESRKLVRSTARALNPSWLPVLVCGDSTELLQRKTCSKRMARI